MLKLIMSLLLIPALLLPAVARAEDGRISEGDLIKITVYGHDDLTTSTRVQDDGTIVFPFIGEVGVSGLTSKEASHEIALRLDGDYIIGPQVTTVIVEHIRRRVVIIGEVNNEGTYEIGRTTTLLELISMAGGLTEDSGSTAIIRRKMLGSGGELGEDVITVDLRALIRQGDVSLDQYLVDGDRVSISASGSFYIIGEVKRPDAYKLKEGTSVLKAVTVAGGFTDRAAMNKIRIVRFVDGQRVVFENVALDEPVMAEDQIIVPLSWF